MGIRRGRKEASENLTISEEGDCPRCGGESVDSTISGFLLCSRCNYEWKDPDTTPEEKVPPPNYRRDEELIDEFKQELENGELKDLLGIDKNLSSEQEQSLVRLQDKWMGGMQGQFNAAAEERTPLSISFDDDDNLVETTVASMTLVANDTSSVFFTTEETVAKDATEDSLEVSVTVSVNLGNTQVLLSSFSATLFLSKNRG